MIEEILKKITVRIKNSSGQLLGTGLLWIHPNDKKNIHIFTAGHVFDNEDSEYKMDISFEGLVGEHSFKSSDVFYHEKFKKIKDSYIFDSAVIRLCLDYEVCNYNYNICYTKADYHMEAKSYGFSRNSNKNEALNSGIPLSGITVSEYDELNKEFKFSLYNQLDQADRKSELKGTSGAALLMENGGIIEFIGIVTGGYGVNATNNIIVCHSSVLFFEILSKLHEYNLEEGYGTYKTFDFVKEDVVFDYENKHVKDYLMASIQDIIEQKGVTPQTLIEAHDDCYNIPTCNVKIKQRCKTRWKNKLLLVSLFNAMGIDEADFQKPIVKLDEENTTQVHFICSEGHGNGVKMSSLISSVNDTIINGLHEFSDGSTLIWSSQGTPNRKYISREKYEGIIKDINKSPENFFKVKAPDIKNGNDTSGNYSIVHIHKLQEELDLLDDDCTMDDIIRRVKEVIINVDRDYKI